MPTREVPDPRRGRFELFVASAPGLEPLLEAELRALAVSVRSVEPGGVTVETDSTGLARLHLRAGLALDAWLHVGRFIARRFDQFEKHVRRLPWRDLLPAGASVRAVAHARRSRLYHTGALTERLEAFIEAAPSGTPTIEVRARLDRDVCTISLVTSGAPLSQRGYRTESGKAPLREDLARALLRLAGWPERGGLLFDPMCGSGTLLIEGALLAAGRAPGLGRAFVAEQLPFVNADAFAAARAEALDGSPAPVGELGPVCVGSDRDAGAVAAAQRNAARAGVEIHAQRAAVSGAARRIAELGARGGLVVCNPPYGRRISAQRDLRALYQTLGREVRALGPSWTFALVLADPRLAHQTGLPLEPRLVTDHGGRKIHLFTARSPSS